MFKNPASRLARCRLARCSRGNIAIMFAASLIPIIGSIGLGVDVARAYAVKSRMANALDAAALAVGSSTGTTAQLNQVAQNFFNANYPTGIMGAIPTVHITVNGDVITATASATLSTVFMKVLGKTQMTVSASSEVIRKITGLELAMVLDNTGSMTTNNNIASLRDAANELVTILFGSYTTHPTLKIALVPYSAAVNPGAVAASLVGAGAAYDAVNVTGWKGCVVERASPNTLADTPAATALWTRYSWAPAIDNSYTAGVASTIKADPSNGNSSTGPNVGCPTPITPLTNVKSTLTTAITAMQAWSRGGTLGDIGMAWGLRVLSPESPFTEGQPWGTPNLTKAVIMMTDGVNQVYKLTSTSGANKVNSAVHSDYTGYGRLDELGRVGSTTIAGAQTVVDSRMAALCETMKAKKIVVYTIVFTGTQDAATKAMYKSCASDDSKFFDAPSQTDLKNAFTAIAVSLSNLRISQ
ncbi:pilus assembly protein TadG [Paramagnetospirillum kuznetsovii]|uniref:Pilus assembly protein TadG n=1 Tax=Paramagnetospirillum kuznetsovii TaxID=2053833 RepID=A0A364NVW8_9PROT|nr:TadE/TadG family type IV pilus assembly protein [Paramagnetospirillum kuznetsovii]RAU21140.1 pilus assembly protein TadG [Paramagnetospirillum kuznetsovii]